MVSRSIAKEIEKWVWHFEISESSGKPTLYSPETIQARIYVHTIYRTTVQVPGQNYRGVYSQFLSSHVMSFRCLILSVAV